jgi:hypothetical protein
MPVHRISSGHFPATKALPSPGVWYNFPSKKMKHYTGITSFSIAIFSFPVYY